MLVYYVACYISIGGIQLSTHYGHYIRMLHSATDQAMTNAVTDLELTAAQCHIMGFITHRETPPCSRDIEEVFHLSHPTVSGILSRLEKKGFISIRPDEYDRRYKRIYVLPKGYALDDTMQNTIVAIEQRLVSGFSEAEQEQFRTLLIRAIDNLDACPCKHKHKEETT